MKVRKGVQEAFKRGSEWVMFVDADDLVSARLAEFCDLQNHDAICFGNGYSWEIGSNFLLRIPLFHQVCGTSWLCRLSPRFFPIWLGKGQYRICDQSHSTRLAALVKDHARIQTIEDPMAIYRVGHLSNTGHGKFLGTNFANLSHPLNLARQLAKRIIRGKRLTVSLRQEFSLPNKGG